jgi:2-beta-glucuronyltransferase
VSLPPKSAVIFSYHTVGFGARKASVVFLAEALAGLGWQTNVVTTQLSRLSVLAGVPRLKNVPEDRRNIWIDLSDRLSAFVWVPLFHPATTGVSLLNRMATPFFALYPHLLPESIRSRVRSSQLIVIESCTAVLLLPLLRKLAPTARFVYRACDPLNTVGMHPMLQTVLDRTAAQYDLFTSPSRGALAGYNSDVKTCYLPQGIDKSLLDASVPSPLEEVGPHAILAGDMMFDYVSVEMMMRNFPNITFHLFGRMNVERFSSFPNLAFHGEVPFEALRNFMVHADIGIAPYLDHPACHYLSESSLKLVQYTYARLPILAPHFCKGGRDHLKGYTPGDEDSIVRATEDVLRVNRQAIDRSGIFDWNEIAEMMLAEVSSRRGASVPEHPAMQETLRNPASG